MLQFLLVAFASVVTNAQTTEKSLADHLFEGRTWRNENWDAVVNTFGLVNFKWTTTLPTNTVINETAYLAESKNALLMKSRDRDLRGDGYDKSTSLIDFDTGMIAFRTKFPTTNTLVASNGMSRRERRRKLRKLLAGKEQACFIINTSVTLAEVKEELQNRVNSSPVPTGTPKKFVAEEKNRVSSAELAKLNGKIAKFCSRAAPHNNNFRLVKDSTATTHADNLVVMGQFDSTQNATSIPYEIHVEQSIIDALQKLATTNTESPAAAGEAPVGVLPEAAEEV